MGKSKHKNTSGIIKSSTQIKMSLAFFPRANFIVTQSAQFYDYKTSRFARLFSLGIGENVSEKQTFARLNSSVASFVDVLTQG